LDLIDAPGSMERGPYLGAWFQRLAESWISCDTFPFITQVVSCGTDMRLYIDEQRVKGVTGRKIAALMVQKGLLVTSFGNAIRMSPPLVLTDEEMERGMKILKEALEDVVDYDSVPRMEWTGVEWMSK